MRFRVIQNEADAADINNTVLFKFTVMSHLCRRHFHNTCASNGRKENHVSSGLLCYSVREDELCYKWATGVSWTLPERLSTTDVDLRVAWTVWNQGRVCKGQRSYRPSATDEITQRVEYRTGVFRVSLGLRLGVHAVCGKLGEIPYRSICVTWIVYGWFNFCDV
jgi:hypothetical protein